MKTKRKKKRYLTAEQIIDEIDMYKIKHQKFLDQAAALDLKAEEMARQGFSSEEIAWNRNQADRIRATAARIKEVRLVHLKHKLAEFLTPPHPALIPDDQSISS